MKMQFALIPAPAAVRTYLQSRRPFSPPVAWAIVLTLVLCLHQSAGQSETICCLLNSTMTDVQEFEVVGDTFDQATIAELLGWDGDAATNTDVLNGICDLLTLRDIAENVQGTGAVDLGRLLERNVQDACTWLYGYGGSDPDNCKTALRYFCFRKRTASIALNSLLLGYDCKNYTCSGQ